MKIKDEYNKKYAELSLTGNIPINPKYIYEYDLPKDFGEPFDVISNIDSNPVDYEICLNKHNELVLNTATPLVYLCYRPKEDTEDIQNNTFNECSLFGLSDLEREVATKLAMLREANIKPKNITFSWKNFIRFNGYKCGTIITFQDLPVVGRIGQTEDFIIGV